MGLTSSALKDQILLFESLGLCVGNKIEMEWKALKSLSQNCESTEVQL
jgi:hypothetical protein